MARKLPFLIFFFFTNLCFSQSYNWITPNKTYLKLFVIQDGIYRINKNDFIQAGVQTNFDPHTVKIFHKGTQIPIYFEGEADGVFNDSDYFDFYGTRNYGGITNTYKELNGSLVIDYVTNEYYNFYSDTNVYWVGWDGLQGLRYSISAYNTTTPYPDNYHYSKLHFEKDLLYSLGETVNANADFRYFNNEKVSGEGWFWKELRNTYGLTVSDTFLVSNFAATPQTCTFRVFAYPNSKDTSFNEHKLVLKINSTTVATIARNDYDRFDTTVTFSSSVISAAANNIISATYSPTFGNPSLVKSLYFDMMEIQYPVKFTFSSGYLKINGAGTDTASRVYKINGFTGSNPAAIYDITNNIKITGYSSNQDTLIFTGKGNSSFEVYNKNITVKPFRIISKQVPDLVSANNGADYIVIYNDLFTSQAEDLRLHRQSRDNFRSVKASVSDVIDIFNYGIEDPAAIRNFVSYAYSNWQTPRLQYVCLFGRGSLDPKNNKLTGTYYKNLIPVYGNPLTDGYFANISYGAFTYVHNISVGRLPAYTQLEAQDIVDKIIAYDNQIPDYWWKTFIMITGGSTKNEQQQYQTQSNSFINSYINFPPLSSDAHKIYRNDSAGYVTYNFKDSIRNEINRGGIIVNFIGHAASQDWEVGMEDPNTLSNGNKLPLVLSITCFTGRNSETSYRSFGEKFVYLPEKCAIGFVGSSGWSFSGPGNNYNGYLFEGLSLDSMRRIGDLLKYATVQMAPDSVSFAVKNTINCYNLLGDPATKLILPVHPEFSIMQTDYKISNQYPSINEEIELTAFPKNFGTNADSCKLQFLILRNNQNYRQSDTILRNFAFLDTAIYRFKLDTLGNYTLKITLDPDNWYPEDMKYNNSISFQLPLRNISLMPLKPIHNSVINKDTVEIVGLNPQVNPSLNTVKIILQIDTSKSFIQPVYTGSVNASSGVVTKFNVKIPILDSNLVYHWRTNSVINNDSTGWTAYNNFIYNSSVSSSYSARIISDSNITIYSRLPGQFGEIELNNLFYTGSGFELRNFTGNLLVRSYGSNGNEASYFIINNYTVFIDGGSNPGLNIVKLSRLTGKLIEFRNFRLPAAQSNDTLLAFLNTFDSTQFIMMGNASYTPCAALNAAVKLKIRQFGSIYVDSVAGLGAFNTWALIGYLGANPNNTSEQYHNYSSNNTWTPSYANLTPVFLSTSGSLSFNTGPAHRWKNFGWKQVLYPNTSIKFDIFGINRTNDSALLYSNLNFNSLVNLDTLSSYNYPSLFLKAKINIDTMLGLRSPMFHSFTFRYTPPAEITPDNYSFIKSDSVVEEGKEVTISVKTYNAGYVPANTVINKWSATSPSGIKILKIDTSYTPLYPDSSKVSTVTFSTNGLKHNNNKADTVFIYFETGISGNENDYYTFNNIALTNITVTGDSLAPSIDVTYDGQKILNGDLIPAKPEIIYKFYPNPMKNETYFTFDFFSDKNPPGCKIKIYTVAGRLVKEIETAAKVGFNQIYWDGRDSDGETMANGIYLYKLILEDAARTETSIQKLAILR